MGCSLGHYKRIFLSDRFRRSVLKPDQTNRAKKQELRALRQDAFAVCASISEQRRVIIRATVVFTVTAAVVVEVIVVGS